ncbi:hypothetical protein [Microcoleus sp. FACHB-68]|nr:hypothetical protein [Microcoleus sp. FACHB-68]MBD1935974.1 hypothetical protein [Microcoleus sp. FACHB-68]
MNEPSDFDWAIWLQGSTGIFILAHPITGSLALPFDGVVQNTGSRVVA